ncbi:MAG: M43 family zinc metalloprotease [Saprospiraceae bacterium]|nr:M43 family zinc metalloprotease [Saprospiraceae bacterium]
MHIIVRDEVTDFDGRACGTGIFCNHLFLNNWHKRLENGPCFQNDWYGAAVYMAKVLVHETGHIAGLCHSFNANSQYSVDLDIVAECNIPGATGGGGCDIFGCNNGASLSTNIMGYNGRSSSLSPCQWRVYSGRLLVGSPGTGKRPEFIQLGACTDIGALPPITILSGTTVTWSSPQVIGGSVFLPYRLPTNLSK